MEKVFGRKDFDKEMQLIEMMDSSGAGAVFSDFRKAPEEMISFIRSQYERFRVPLPPSIDFMCEVGAALALHTADVQDPYLLFWDHSDVTMTEEWQEFCYDLRMADGSVIEAQPEKLETFRFIEGAAEKFFNEHMGNPGLKAMGYSPGISAQDAIDDFRNEHMLPYALWNYRHEICLEFEAFRVDRILANHCVDPETGEVIDSMMDAYYDLAVWAGMMWILGPLSREWRVLHSELCEVAIQEGECILYDGNVISRRHYSRYQRPSQSCYKCGIAAWCTELTIDCDGVARNICEGCLSKGMPQLPGTSCGTKFCKYWQCPHNVHYQDQQGMQGAMRNHGQLAQKRDAMQGGLLGIAPSENRNLLDVLF